MLYRAIESGVTDVEKRQVNTTITNPTICGGDDCGINEGVHSRPVPKPSTTQISLQTWRWRSIGRAVRYALIVLVIGLGLAIPIMVTVHDRIVDDDQPTSVIQSRNLVFYLFAWLLTTWLCACASDLIALSIPHLFRLITTYINPAHRRYWTIFRAFRLPLCLLGTVFCSYLSFEYIMLNNTELAVNFNKEADSWGWDDTIDDILAQMTFWVAGYVVEQGIVLYIRVHYHYRTDHVRIFKSKKMQGALVTLYDASTYLQPIGTMQFLREDSIMALEHTTAGDVLSRQASTFLGKIGFNEDSVAEFLGAFGSKNEKSHWFNHNSSYAVVERALAQRISSTALAKRIWMSLTREGSEKLTEDDLTAVLGAEKKAEIGELFATIDENESGNIRLEEFVATVVEAGTTRHSIYLTMADMNHCINTFDWIALLILAFIMIFFILLLYVPTIKDIKDTASFVVVGVSFALGRTVHRFLSGCIFVFFEHPFDVGDRVDVYNSPTVAIPCIVTRQSLLFTLFRRVDNASDLQITNEQLTQKRIENISRSTPNKEVRTVYINYVTSFDTLMQLRTDMEDFLKSNSRDYAPRLVLNVKDLHSLDKLEISLAFFHKTNWADERIRGARSSKFMCALLATMRKLKMKTPTCALVGDPERPFHFTSLETSKVSQSEASSGEKEEAEVAARQMAQQEERTKALAREQEARARLANVPSVPAKADVVTSTAEVRHVLGNESLGIRKVQMTRTSPLFDA